MHHLWVIIPVILAALLARPLSMWVMSKVMGRKVSCDMCSVGTEATANDALPNLEARKAAVEREMAQVQAEMQQGVITQRAAAKAEER